MLDGRLEVRHLPGHLRSVGRQLRADRVEERAELAELVVLIEIELHAELAASEARQAAADHVNRPQQQLRQQHRDEHRHAERRRAPSTQRRPQRRVEIAARISSVETPMRIEPNSVSPSSSGCAELEVAPLARVDRAQLRRAATAPAARSRSPPAGSGCPSSDGSACATATPCDVDDRRERHVLRVEARLEDRAQAGIGRAAPRSGSAPSPTTSRARWKMALASSSARARLSSRLTLRQPRQVQQAQHDDDRRRRST